MAVWAKLMINDHQVGMLTIQRQDPLPEPRTPETVCRYGWTVDVLSTGEYFVGELEHRYDDGLLVLMRKVLDEATTVADPATPESGTIP